jgi:hypothetical protein
MTLLAPLKNPSVWQSPSVIVLVAANLVPLAGVMFFGWEVFPIMLLFWLENIIMGGFNVLKMLLARGLVPQVRGGPVPHLIKLFLVPFFCVHYGGFTVVHGIFVFVLFGGGLRAGPGLSPDLDLVMNQISQQHLWWAVVGLALSHGFSFAWNYVRGREYRTITADRLMMQPYGRVVVLHIAIIGGGFLILALGSPTAALALLVLLKIGLDVIMHVKQNKLGGENPPEDAVRATSSPNSPGKDAA